MVKEKMAEREDMQRVLNIHRIEVFEEGKQNIL